MATAKRCCPVLVALGTAALRMGDRIAAGDAFTAALSTTNADSANTRDSYSRATGPSPGKP